MAILPDHYIRKLVHDSGMINPFIPHQVRAIKRISETKLTDLTVGEWSYSDIPKLMEMVNDPFKAPEFVEYTQQVIKTLTEQGNKILQEQSEEQKIVSYGLSSAGYDVRLDNQFKIFTNINNTIIDPLDIQDKYYVDHTGDSCTIPPGSYALGLTIEYFKIPRNILVVALGKSTYARLGVAINVTPVEPGYEGKVVIEIANQTPLPVKVYANQGIAQFIFHRLEEPCEVSYGDRDGKYQGQNSLQTALI